MGEINKTNNYTEFFYKTFRNILTISIPLVIISALALSLPHSSATTSSTDDITLTLDVACTVSSVVTSPHSALDMHVGQYKSDIGNTDISVFCNDNNGYSVYAVGNSNNVDGNTDLVSNISDSYNIHTGTNITGNSAWAMKLTAGTGSSTQTTPPTIMNGFDNYSTIPNVYTQVAKRTSGTSTETDTKVSGSYFSTTYQIYANSTQPAGTYAGKVKYVMVHPNSNINTVPDLDAAFAVAGKMKVYEEGDNSYYAMQDMDSQICNMVANTGASTATQLVDIRDNSLYWVAKLDDGKCWMTSNLDLDIGGLNTAPLNSNNTDISTDPNVYASSGIYSDYSISNGVYTWNPVSTAISSNTSIAYPNNTNYPTVSPAWPQNNTGSTTPYSAEGKDTYYYTSNSTSNDTRYTSLQACKNANHTEAECKRYFAGNYYNWTAAIASNNSANISTNNDRATNSICPKGWRLPNASQTNNQYNEFGIMLFDAGITAALSNGNESVGYTTNGFNKLRSNPYYFVRLGIIAGGTLYDAGLNGSYWSSMVNNNTYAYFLHFNSSTLIYPARKDNRYYGWAVRCVARSAGG